MGGRVARLSGISLCMLLGACEHKDVALQGTADWVIITYVGDIAETQPIARQHCAQFERVPVLRQTKDNTAIYGCVKRGASS